MCRQVLGYDVPPVMAARYDLRGLGGEVHIREFPVGCPGLTRVQSSDPVVP
jgi:hypothetical protein